MSNSKLWEDAMCIDDKSDAWLPPGEVEIEEGECGSCLGYGYFRPSGEPTVDRRERKCMDCGGTGRAPAKNAPSKE